MKEIRYSYITQISMLVFHVCLTLLYCLLIVYCVQIFLGFILSVFFIFTTYISFSDILFRVRFYGLIIKLLDDKLILGTNNKQCQIPANKDVSVIYCMGGWLIIWPSGDKKNMILLRRNFFLGKGFDELRDYLRLNMNYISSKDEKKRMLKSLHVNVLNPLKYIKWPALCTSLDE